MKNGPWSLGFRETLVLGSVVAVIGLFGVALVEQSSGASYLRFPVSSPAPTPSFATLSDYSCRSVLSPFYLNNNKGARLTAPISNYSQPQFGTTYYSTGGLTMVMGQDFLNGTKGAYNKAALVYDDSSGGHVTACNLPRANFIYEQNGMYSFQKSPATVNGNPGFVNIEVKYTSTPPMQVNDHRTGFYLNATVTSIHMVLYDKNSKVISGISFLPAADNSTNNTKGYYFFHASLLLDN